MSSRRRGASIQHDSMGSVDRRTRDEVVGGMQDKLAEIEAKRAYEEEPIDPELRNNLRELIFLGRMQETIVFDGYEFAVTTLSNSETKALLVDLADYDIRERAMAIRPLALARAIASVNGVPLENLYVGQEELSVLEKRAKVVDNWQTTLVNALFEKYEELLKKSNDLFSSDTLGYDVKK